MENKRGRFQPGMSGNPNGRPKGTPNHTTAMVRQLFATIMEEEQENFKAALEQLRVTSPRDYVAVMVKLSAKFLPDLNVTAMTGLNGEAVQPVQIIIPSDPNNGKLDQGDSVEEAQIIP